MKLSPDSPERNNPDHASATGRAHTVLLAEDEELLRGITALVLRRAGYNVLEAATTKAAGEMAAHSKGAVHVLIADVGLPEIGGVRLFQELAEANPEMKVVFISGYTQDTIRDVAQLPQGTEFLEKPFEQAALLETVGRLLVH